MQGNSARQPPYIAHYGIRGQKWGVRNYQREDGTLTPAGKERYRKGNVDVKKQDERRNWKAKDAKELSDTELEKRNARLNKEQNYKNLTTPEWKKTAKVWSNEAIKAVLVTSTTTVLSQAVKVALKKKVFPFIVRHGAKLLVSILI